MATKRGTTVQCVVAAVGLLSASDGIRKLRQMEVNTGVWTMRVHLIVDLHNVLILDGATGVRFSGSLAWDESRNMYMLPEQLMYVSVYATLNVALVL